MYKLIFFFYLLNKSRGNVLTFFIWKSSLYHWLILPNLFFSVSISDIPDKTFGGLWIKVHCSVTVFNTQFCFVNTHLTLPCLLRNVFYEVVNLQNIYNPVESCLLFRCIKSRTFQTGCLVCQPVFMWPAISYLLRALGIKELLPW